MYLVEIDDGLPEVRLLLVEIPHADLSEVTRVVLLSHRQYACPKLVVACSSSRRTLSMLVRWWC